MLTCVKDCSGIDVHLHSSAVSSSLQHRLSCTTPSRIGSTTLRHPPLFSSRCSRKFSYVNLRVAVLIRYISDEMVVRRKPAIALVEFCRNQRRRFAVAFEWKNPEIQSSFGIERCVEQEAPIP